MRSGRITKPTPKSKAFINETAMKAQKKVLNAKKKAMSSKLKVKVDDLADLFTSVAVGAKSANSQLASGVDAVETGVGAVARETKIEVGNLQKGISKLGGARTKRRRHKKRARYTKKR